MLVWTGLWDLANARESTPRSHIPRSPLSRAPGDDVGEADIRAAQRDWGGEVSTTWAAFDLPIILFLAAALLSLLATEYLRLSLRELRSLVVEPLLFWYLCRATLRNPRDAAWLIGGLLAAASMVAVIGLVQLVLGGAVTDVQGVRRVLGTYTSPNHFALLLGRSLPFLAALGWSVPRWRPWAIVDVLFMGSGENERVLEGMRAASDLFGVPVVGGHTARVAGPSMLAAAVVGRANRLISSHAARPGQTLLMAVDLRGSFRGGGGAFNAATTASAQQLRAGLGLLPELAEAGLVGAGKDISMAGTCGSLAMLLETSGVGAELDLEHVPIPEGVEALRWLTAFPSYGYVLTAEPKDVARVCASFDALGVACAAVGKVREGRELELRYQQERALYLSLADRALTGFGVT